MRKPGLSKRLKHWLTAGISYSDEALADQARFAADGVELDVAEKNALATYRDAQVAAGNIFLQENITLLGNNNPINAAVGIGTEAETGSLVDMTFDSHGGIHDGTTGHIKTGFIPSAKTVLQDDTTSGFYCYSNADTESTLAAYGSFHTVTGRMWLQQNFGTSRINVAINSTAAGSYSAQTFFNNVTLYMGRRSNAAGTITDMVKDGVAGSTTAVVSTGVPDREIYIGAVNNGSATQPFNGVIPWWGIAEDESNFDHVAHEINLIQLLTDLGAFSDRPMLIASGGQSNAVGVWGVREDLPDELKEVISENILRFGNAGTPTIYDVDGTPDADGSYGYFGTTANQASFNPKMVYDIYNQLERPIYMVHHAVSATWLCPENTPNWYPGEVGQLYETFTDRIDVAIAWMDANIGVGLWDFAAFVWLQGGADFGDAAQCRNAYEANEVVLYEDFRTKYGDNILFISCGVPEPQNEVINDQKKLNAPKSSKNFYVDSGLYSQHDPAHFDNDGFIPMGADIAEILIENESVYTDI